VEAAVGAAPDDAIKNDSAPAVAAVGGDASERDKLNLGMKNDSASAVSASTPTPAAAAPASSVAHGLVGETLTP
jgi:hypothetical protein